MFNFIGLRLVERRPCPVSATRSQLNCWCAPSCLVNLLSRRELCDEYVWDYACPFLLQQRECLAESHLQQVSGLSLVPFRGTGQEANESELEQVPDRGPVPQHQHAHDKISEMLTLNFVQNCKLVKQDVKIEGQVRITLNPDVFLRVVP